MAVETFRFLDVEDVPQTFEAVDRDAIHARLEADVIANEPLIDGSVPQPLSQILDVMASYQFNARAYQNALRLGTFVRFATGANLKQRAMERGITPLANETDAALRRRVEAAPYGSTATVAGLERAVLQQFAAQTRSVTFSFDAMTGTTTFTLLAEGTGQDENEDAGTPTAALLTSVDNYLSSDAVSVLGAQDFTGQAPTITKWYARIAVDPLTDTTRDAVLAALTAWQNDTYALNNVVRQQALFRAFDANATLRGATVQIERLNTVGLTDTGLDDLESTATSALLGIFTTDTDATVQIVAG